ncbi:fused (3R)-hydroxyacyl-ACP dehydratase subunits HadA/HadB [Nocardia sp. NPDC052566]|uniref:fused (3R)-hydroxyacyl-ACP dehydratase subunits HadA/HadB n=1 Tax=Nocardia sp. NPDC052566 TaxID=3364330 RepID=UPI0037C523F5
MAATTARTATAQRRRKTELALLSEVDSSPRIRAIVGRHYRMNDHYEVGREKIREYAGAVQDYHPVHWDDTAAAEFGYGGLVASPTFIGLLGAAAQRALIDLLDGYNLTTAVQTDQVIDFHRPAIAGDRLTSNLALVSFRQAFGGDLIVVRNTVTDDLDDPVFTAHTSLIARSEPPENSDQLTEYMSGVIRRDLDAVPKGRVELWPEDPREPAGPPRISARVRARTSVAAGDELPTRVVELTVGDLVHYAGVAGDPNPIHWHSGAAEAVGLEHGIVAHGMLTMAYGAGFVTSWLGDPGALRQYSVRMTSPVHVPLDRPASIEYTGRVKSVDESGAATVALTALHQGRKIFGRATAVVQLS